MDGTLTDTTPPSQSGPESNDNERVLYIPQTLGLMLHRLMLVSVISVEGYFILRC